MTQFKENDRSGAVAEPLLKCYGDATDVLKAVFDPDAMEADPIAGYQRPAGVFIPLPRERTVFASGQPLLSWTEDNAWQYTSNDPYLTQDGVTGGWPTEG